MSALRILYVEDDPLIREVAEMALSLDPGLEVRTADGGAAALALVSQGDWVPDAFLLDVMMPQMDGPQTLAALRQLPGHADTPAVFVTARAQAQEHVPLMEAGALGVLTKPFDPMTFAQEVRSLLERR